ncbi:Hydroquinone glucosyltransferase [Triticum urartu]|uniref:Hydroquinone glucosyltransferase n=1 Tax=Triticum urartu TaxID=4572 RepID=M8A8M8_TRIUA|nr:Hydroquinone glucosyltransferase [Triticum urartu]
MASLSSMGSASAAAAPPAERLAARPHVILLASPGAGHLIPLAELARRLVELHGFAATIVTFTNFSAPELLACLPASVATVALPAVQMDDLPKNGGVLVELTRRSLPNIRALVRSISNSTSTAPLAALVADFMCSTALPIAAELGVPGYLFVPSNLAHVALTRYVIEINEGVAPGEYRDLAVPLELPGGVSLRHADLPDGYRSKHEGYVQTVEWSRCHCLGDGVLVNTFYEMEPATVEAFKQLASVGCGVPMLAWPLYAEQRMNALLLEQNLGMALRVPPSREDGRCLVTRHEIAKAVKELMEGDQKVRRRAEDLQKAAARAWLPEGPSRRALEEVAVKWKAALGTAK